MQRVNISMSKQLLELIDKEAGCDFTTRSDIIRIATLWYLRPQGRELRQTDPETILRTLQDQRRKQGINLLLRGNNKTSEER